MTKNYQKQPNDKRGKIEPPEGFEPPSITNYVIALLLSYSGLLLIYNKLSLTMCTIFSRISVAKIQLIFDSPIFFLFYPLYFGK